MNKECINDNDCGKNICSFNENDLNHYCIDSNVNTMYYGCLSNNNNNDNNLISTGINKNNTELKQCIDFSRRQLTEDGFESNFMLYRPKKKVFVDTTTIDIYLKCGEQILIVIPYSDYFTLQCGEDGKICTLESKKQLNNFIKSNSRNCKENLYLEVSYQCENEGIKKVVKIPIMNFNNDKIKIKLACPINVDNAKFKTHCESLFIDTKKANDILDVSTNIDSCSSPVFIVPRLISDVEKYKKIKIKESSDEIKNFDEKIVEKVGDLRELESKKYMKLMKLQHDKDISLEEAREIVDRNNLGLNFKDRWKTYNDYDGVQNLFLEDEKEKLITYYGKVFTLEEAISVASELKQYYFVWYHNSYQLDDYASKLYFIDIYTKNVNLLKKSNWIKYENVTTCILKDYINYILDPEDDDDMNKLKEVFTQSNTNTVTMTDKINEIVSKNYLTLSTTINQDLIDGLDTKITTYGQMISMNNFETDVNDKILMGMSILLIFMILIFVATIAYFNAKQKKMGLENMMK